MLEHSRPVIEPLGRWMSCAEAPSKREIGADDDEYQESQPSHSHQASVSDGSRSLRLCAGDGSDGGDDDREAEPCEPVHDLAPQGAIELLFRLLGFMVVSKRSRRVSRTA